MQPALRPGEDGGKDGEKYVYLWLSRTGTRGGDEGELLLRVNPRTLQPLCAQGTGRDGAENGILILGKSGIPHFPAFLFWQRERWREVGEREKSQAGAGGGCGWSVCTGAICK